MIRLLKEAHEISKDVQSKMEREKNENSSPKRAEDAPFQKGGFQQRGKEHRLITKQMAVRHRCSIEHICLLD